MGEPTPRKPTNAELSILKILWDRGPCTVRQIHRTLSRNRDMLYTTVLKVMQNMTEKRLVSCDRSRRAFVYTALTREEDTRRQLVGEMLDRLFGGSAAELVAHALTRHDATTEELAGIRRLLDEVEAESGT